jgi:hypothetical protein
MADAGATWSEVARLRNTLWDEGVDIIDTRLPARMRRVDSLRRNQYMRAQIGQDVTQRLQNLQREIALLQGGSRPDLSLFQTHGLLEEMAQEEEILVSMKNKVLALTGKSPRDLSQADLSELLDMQEDLQAERLGQTASGRKSKVLLHPSTVEAQRETARRTIGEATGGEPLDTPALERDLEEKARLREGELRREIHQQERRLSDLDPSSPSGRDARRRINSAKSLLRGMGRLVAVATPLATLYEGAAYAQDVAEEGPVGGTRKYVGEGIEGLGALGSGFEAMTEVESLEERAGLPPSAGTRLARVGGDVVGAIGKGLGYLGRAIVGSDEEEEEIPIAVNPSGLGGEDPIWGTPAEMRREAARRAVARERAKKE